MRGGYAVTLFVFRLQKKLLGGTLTLRLGTSLFVMIFMTPNFLAAPMCLGLRKEQMHLFLSGGSRCGCEGYLPATTFS